MHKVHRLQFRVQFVQFSWSHLQLIVTLHRIQEIKTPVCGAILFCKRSLAHALKHPRLGIAQASLALLSARRSLAHALKHSRLGIAQASLALLSARRSLAYALKHSRSLKSWNNQQNSNNVIVFFIHSIRFKQFSPLLSCEAMGGVLVKNFNVVIKEHDINIIYI